LEHQTVIALARYARESSAHWIRTLVAQNIDKHAVPAFAVKAFNCLVKDLIVIQDSHLRLLCAENMIFSDASLAG
jgi:hypothetical protein